MIGAMIADYVRSGGKWPGPRAGVSVPGYAAWLLGFSFISEGAIPFAAADPVRIIASSVVGSAITGALVMSFGATLRAPHGGIWVVPLIGNFLLFVVALAVGVLVMAAIVVALKSRDRHLAEVDASATV